MNPVCVAHIPVQLSSAHLFISFIISQCCSRIVIAALCNVLSSSLSHYCLPDSGSRHNVYVYINFEFENALKHKIMGLKTHLGVAVLMHSILTEKDFISLKK